VLTKIQCSAIILFCASDNLAVRIIVVENVRTVK